MLSTSIRNLLLFLFGECLFILLLSSSSNAGEPETNSYQSLAEAGMDSLIVASVGPLDITAREFLLSYEYGPAFYKKMKEPQRKFLDFMINEKLLALEGYDRGVEKKERATEMLSQIEGDLITEQLFREDVMSRVNISEEELRKAVEREKVNLKVRWLYTDSYREMQRQSQDLKSGIPFDSLFVQQLHDSIKIDDRSLEDSRFRIELKNPDLSKILDTLSCGTVSPPIQTPDGWYFVKIENSWVNAITTESEAFALRKRVKDALFKYKMDVLSDQYIREMMSDADPVIVRNTFDLLQNYLAQKYLPPEKLADWNLTGQVLEEFGPVNVSEIDAFGEKQLVRIRKGEINLRDFLIWYRTRENYIKLSYASRKRFFISLQQVVWRMVRDHLLVERAEQRGFQDREIVRKQKQWWKSKIAFSIAREEIGQSIPMTEDKLLDYYQQHSKEYSDNGGKILPYQRVKEDVSRDYYSGEMTKRMLYRILKLKQQYAVRINNEALKRISRYIQREPKAAKIYVVKKDGTFPRPAYPTIDFEWQNWY